MPLFTTDTILQISTLGSLFSLYRSGSIEYVPGEFAFSFRVTGKLFDGDFPYGVFGPVVQGPSKFEGLICSAMLRVVPLNDWNRVSKDYANFVIGPTAAQKNNDYNDHGTGIPFFRHPEGVIVDGFPLFGRYGSICEKEKV